MMTDTAELTALSQGLERNLYSKWDRWIDRDDTGYPTLLERKSPSQLPNTTYLITTVYRCEFVGDQMDLYQNDAASATRFTLTGTDPHGRYIFRSAGLEGDSVPKNSETLLTVPDVDVGQLQLQLPDGTLLIKVPQAAKSRDDADWDGTFASQNRMPFDTWIYQGHDILATDPTNLQRTNPLRKYVFAYPAGDSKDFHMSREGTVHAIPDGSELLTMDGSLQKMTDASITSEQGYQQAWSSAVGAKSDSGFDISGEEEGIKVGVGANSHFALSTEFRDSFDADVKSSYGATQYLGVFSRNAHVIDAARVKLDPDFVARIEELCDDGEFADHDVDSLIDAFGTHFANAVTLGGISRRVDSYTEQGVVFMISHGFTIGTESEEGAKVVVASGSGSSSEEDKVDTSRKDQIDGRIGTSSIDTIGGTAGTDSFSVSDADQVPITADLRPLSVLMNPVLVTSADAASLTRLRAAFDRRVAARAEAATPFDTTSLLPIPVVEMEIVSISNPQALASFVVNCSMTIRPTRYAPASSGPGMVLLPPRDPAPDPHFSTVSGARYTYRLPDPVPPGEVLEVGVRAQFALTFARPTNAITLLLDGGSNTDVSSDDEWPDAIGTVPLKHFTEAPKSTTFKMEVPMLTRDANYPQITVRYRNCGGPLKKAFDAPEPD